LQTNQGSSEEDGAGDLEQTLEESGTLGPNLKAQFHTVTPRRSALQFSGHGEELYVHDY
jgi:hypothetical protein